MAVSLLLLPLATHTTALPMLATGMALAWFCVSDYNINQIGLRQGVTPERMLGRMNATVRFVIGESSRLAHCLVASSVA